MPYADARTGGKSVYNVHSHAKVSAQATWLSSAINLLN
jgi:hypothetical protein